MSDDETGDRTGEQDTQDADETGFNYEYPDDLLSGDRERGLTKNDRRFLVTGKNRHGEEPSDKSRVNMRTRVRKRIRETIVDFWLTMQYLDDYDRDLVFEPRSPPEDWEMREGIKNTMQFFYRGLEDSDLMDFETALTSAVHDAEHDRHRGPVLVETEFEVDVDEQFRVQEAYDKFRKHAPLEPMEVGALLVTGRISDPREIQKLAAHARRHGVVQSTVSSLAARQLADILGGPVTEDVMSTVSHGPELNETPDADSGSPRPSVRGQDILEWDFTESDPTYAGVDDLPSGGDAEILDEDLAEDLEGADREDSADRDETDSDGEEGDTESSSTAGE